MLSDASGARNPDKSGKRIAFGSISQESNTFSPIRTTIETFESYFVHRGEEVLSGYGGARTEVSGFIAALQRSGAVPIPLLAAYAAAGGTVERGAFDTLVEDLIARLGNAGPVDGVLLALHGALVVEDQPDGDGEIIARVRAALPFGVPIAVTLDLHGHITPLMLQPDTFHIAYKEYPHTDMFETGERATELLLETIAGKIRPVMAMAKRHVILSPVCTRTTDGPFVPIYRRARALEASGRVLHAGLFPVQPWIDVPDLGFAALVCAENEGTAQQAADELADMVWEARDAFFPELTAIEDAIRIGLSSEGLTAVSDAGDAPTGGAAADSPAVLDALLKAGADKSERLTYLTLCDAPAVRRAIEAGVGSEVALKVGHSLSTGEGRAVAIDGTVLSLSDGGFRMRDGGAEGLEISMGDVAVIGIGSIRLVLRSLPSMEWDTGVYTSQGLDPERAALVFVKSPSHFRSGYGPIAARILVANTPGPTTPDMRRIPFRRVTRPLFPQDVVTDHAI